MSSTNPQPRATGRTGGPRSGAAAPVTVLVALAVLLSASGFLTAPAPSAARHRAAALVGADGHREFFHDDDNTVVLETARLRGGPLANSGPQSLSRVEDNLGALLTGNFVRVSRKQRTADGVTSSLSIQKLDNRGVTTVMEVGDEGPRVFTPGMLVLPRNVRAGDFWRGSGEITPPASPGAVEPLPYSFEAHATTPGEEELAAADCLTIERTETRGGQDATSTHTWCPGRGVVREGDSTHGAPPTAPDVDVAVRPWAWEPARWELTSAPIPLAPPMQWGTELTPVPVDGALVLAHQTSGDLIFLPASGPERAWRAHPGGSVTMLAAIGNVVVAATTLSRLTLWDTDGMPLWEAVTGDLVFQPPVLLGTTLVVADDSGLLMGVDVRTGRQVWNMALSERLTAAPLVCGDTILVATTAPRLLALSADGAERWERDLEDRADAMACTGVGVAVAIGGVRLHHIALDATPLASVPLRVGFVDALLLVGTVVVAQSDLGLSAHDPDRGLQRVWRSDDLVIDAVTDGTRLVTLGPDGFTALDAAGTIMAQWDADVAPEGSAPHLVADVDSVLVLGADMTLTRLR